MGDRRASAKKPRQVERPSSGSYRSDLAVVRFGVAERRAIHALLAEWAFEELVTHRQCRATEHQHGNR